MKKTWLTSTAIATALALALGTAVAQEESTMSKAGNYVSEKAAAVKDATKDAWDATKEKTGEIAEKAKDKAGDAWDATKEKNR